MLSGITVLDLSQVGPGPRCTSALADLGADVVKVLPPEASGRIEPEWWAYGAGRGTRRIRVDLKVGAEVFLRMVERADVVVESYRPGVADRLGIGYDACRERNPQIVYAAITGYGQDGPYAAWAGHDLDYLAVGGFLGMQGTRADGGPALPGATIADAAAGGWQAALAICAALVKGDGAYLDVSTTAGVLALMALDVDRYLATGTAARPGQTLLTGRYACYDVYACGDGRWVAVAAIEGRFFANLCEALGRPELAELQYDDDRQDEVRAAFRDAFASRGRDEWVAELAGADTCVAPVLSVEEIDGPVVEARHPEHGRFPQLGPLLAGAVQRDVPGGTDADDLLGSAGYTSDEIAELKRTEVVA